MNDKLKFLLVAFLSISVVVFAWFGKIDPSTFTGFVSAALMWFLNSNKIRDLKNENKDLSEKITIMADKARIITENQIKTQG